MKAGLPGLVAVIALAAGAAQAKDKQPTPNSLSYDYLRAGYVSQQSDYFHDGAHGYSLEGSFLVNDHVYLLGSATRLDFNQLPGTQRVYGAGIGYQENPRGDISAFLQAEVFHASADTTPSRFGDRADTYARFSWGFRTLIDPHSPWEIDGAVYDESHTDFGHRNFGLWLGIGAVWDHVSVRVVGDYNNTQETVRAELGWYF